MSRRRRHAHHKKHHKIRTVTIKKVTVPRGGRTM